MNNAIKNAIGTSYLYKQALCWIGLLTLAICEYVLFRTYVLREVIPFYPNNHDQASYLSGIYSAYERLLSHKLNRNTFAPAVFPNSFIFGIQTVIIFLFFGASRLSALSLNFVCFVLLQIIAFFSVRSITKRVSLAFLFLGLLLSVNTPFFWAGSMNDYRIDFMAFCTYGILITSIIKSNVFLDRKWVVISALLAVYLILLRFITSVYVVSSIAVLFLVYVLQCIYFKKSKNPGFAFAKTRIKNLVIFFVVILAACFPFLFILKNRIYNYYVVGHLTGSEKYIRAREAGITNLMSNLSYYPRSIFYDHFGILASTISLSLLFLVVTFYLASKSYRNSDKREDFGSNILFLSIAFIVPIVALTLNLSKSPVVGGIVIVPLVWLVMCIFIYFYQGIVKAQIKYQFLFKIMAIIFFAVGSVHYIANFVKHSDLSRRDHIIELNNMYCDIGDYLHFAGLRNPMISADQVVDHLLANLLNIIYYERKGIFLDAQNSVLGGGGVFAVNEEDAIQALHQSDIYIVNLKDNYPVSVYPANQSLELLRPVLMGMAEKEMVVLNDYHFLNSTYRVYVRPSFKISDLSGEWITASGVRIMIPGFIAHKTKAIVLQGASLSFKWLPKDFEIITSIENEDLSQSALNNTLAISGDQYKIKIDLPDWHKQEPLVINVTSSSYFVPKDVGLNSDTRELVLMGPTAKEVILKSK